MKLNLTTSRSLFDRALHSLKWSFLLEAVGRLVPPVTYLVLTQLLTPEHFGEVATANIIISFLQIFVDFGLGKALIQTKLDVKKSMDVVFWMSALLGVSIFALLYILSGYVTMFFENPGSETVIRILGLQIIFYSLAVSPQMLLIRDMSFQKLFWMKLAANLIPAFISIPLAIGGQGVWALVGGTIAGSFVNLVLLWLWVDWRPSFSVDFSVSRPLLIFGFWTFLEGLGTWFFWWGDNLVVRKVFGNLALGSYQVAWSLVSFAFALTVGSFTTVLYSLFSRIGDDSQLLKRTFDQANTTIIAIALPVGISICLTSGYLQEIFFRADWINIDTFLQAFGLLFGFSWLVGINAELYRAIGRPDVNTKILFFSILYYLPIYLITSRISLDAFALGRLVAALLSIPIHMFMIYRVAHYSPLYLWRQSKFILLACGVMVSFILGYKYLLQNFLMIPTIINLILVCFMAVASYLSSLLILDRPFLKQVFAFVQKILRSGNVQQ